MAPASQEGWSLYSHQGQTYAYTQKQGLNKARKIPSPFLKPNSVSTAVPRTNFQGTIAEFFTNKNSTFPNNETVLC
jgi:hypothetical protein